ncbi:MAG: hypothetical protein HWD59_04995 [Coxiellaceae bacterium]|nr:MAG: hypothetical protein HWD59_04995 [Coxiellaceae bacterium]
MNEHEWDSVSFDSDEYQAETIILSKDGSHYISGSTYYALLGNVESAIDPSFRQEFIRQTPEVRMLNCMASIKHWDGNLAYLVANQLVDPASFYCEDPNLDLRPKLSDELISAWQARLTSLYRGLIKSNSVTHKEILIRLSPVLYYAIETVRPKHQTDHGLDLLELFQELTSSQLVLENLLNDKLDTITLEAEDGRSNSKTTLREHLAQFKTTMLMALEFRLHHIHDAMQNYIHTLKILNDPNVSDAILTSVVVKIQAEFPLLENLRISDTKLTFLLKSVGREEKVIYLHSY